MNRLKLLRNEYGEGLEKIARYLNVTVQTISNYENEKRDMTPDTIIKLADYFNVSTDYLLGKSNNKNETKLNLSETERIYINKLQKLTKKDKKIIEKIIEILIEEQGKEYTD